METKIPEGEEAGTSRNYFNAYLKERKTNSIPP